MESGEGTLVLSEPEPAPPSAMMQIFEGNRAFFSLDVYVTQTLRYQTVSHNQKTDIRQVGMIKDTDT